MGEIILTAGSVANGTPASGQLLPIATNQALFSLLGVDYGGDGITTFTLPDLQGGGAEWPHLFHLHGRYLSAQAVRR